MNISDFERLKESVRQMVAIEMGEMPASRVEVFSGKVLTEVKENGVTTWSLIGAANALRESVEAGDVKLPEDTKNLLVLLRKVLRQSQEGFAELLDIPLSTLRNWEQGRRTPQGPAHKLIQVMARRPDAVLESTEELVLAD